MNAAQAQLGAEERGLQGRGPRRRKARPEVALARRPGVILHRLGADGTGLRHA